MLAHDRILTCLKYIKIALVELQEEVEQLNVKLSRQIEKLKELQNARSRMLSDIEFADEHIKQNKEGMYTKFYFSSN